MGKPGSTDRKPYRLRAQLLKVSLRASLPRHLPRRLPDAPTALGRQLHALADRPQLSAIEVREIDTTGYQRLRIAIALLGLALPVVLALLGGPEHIRNSLSAYYYEGKPALFGMLAPRDVFVGSLFAIGVFLHSYDGCSRGEVLACNLAGVLAMVIAVCPMDPPQPACCHPGHHCDHHLSLHAMVHYGAAAGFFVLIIAVAAFLRDTTLSVFDKLGQPGRKRVYARLYTLLAALMAAVPPGAFAAYRLLGSCEWPHGVLAVEVAGVWIFSLFWLVKAREVGEIERLLEAREV